jgi:uncharacterized protein
MVSAENGQIELQHSGRVPGDRVVDACNDPPPAPLLQGIEEFNEGRYWECHETLEALWRAEPRPVRDLYQGILQVGVGFHHLRRGNYAGAVKVLGRALVRLERLPEICQGVHIAELLAAAQTVYNRVRGLGPEGVGQVSMKALPYLRVDAARKESQGR